MVNKNFNVTKKIKLFYKLSNSFAYFVFVALLSALLVFLGSLILADSFKNLSQQVKNNFYIFLTITGCITLICGALSLCVYLYCNHLRKNKLEKFGLKFAGYVDDAKFISELETKFIMIRALGLALSGNGNTNENLFLLTKEQFYEKNLPFSHEDLHNFQKDWKNINDRIALCSKDNPLMNYLNQPLLGNQKVYENGMHIRTDQIKIGRIGVLEDMVKASELVYIFDCAIDPCKNFKLQKSMREALLHLSTTNRGVLENPKIVEKTSVEIGNFWINDDSKIKDTFDSFKDSNLFKDYQNNLKILRKDKNLDVFGTLNASNNKRFLPENLLLCIENNERSTPSTFDIIDSPPLYGVPFSTPQQH